MEVAQGPRDMAVRPPGERWAVTHDAPGIAALVAQLPTMAPRRMGLDATGGDQRAVVAARAAVGLPVVVVDPRQARDVANATGPLAKTDVREARTLAHVAMQTAAQNRLGGASQRLRVAIHAPMTGLNTHVATLDDERDTSLRASPIGREHEALLRSVPGLGPVCPRPLRLALPAFGTLSRRRLAALVGVAPVHRDRRTMRGVRAPWGGRAPVRTTVDRSMLVAVRDHPVRNRVYERLWAAGNAPKVALTACMRTLLTILNAMVKHQKP
jgi:transposase